MTDDKDTCTGGGRGTLPEVKGQTSSCVNVSHRRKKGKKTQADPRVQVLEYLYVTLVLQYKITIHSKSTLDQV